MTNVVCFLGIEKNKMGLGNQSMSENESKTESQFGMCYPKGRI